jgi:hypothetical protein
MLIWHWSAFTENPVWNGAAAANLAQDLHRACRMPTMYEKLLKLTDQIAADLVSGSAGSTQITARLINASNLPNLLNTDRRTKPMKRTIVFVMTTLLMLTASQAIARDTIHKLSIADFMVIESNASRLAGVSYYFGDQAHPAVKTSLGEFQTNKKTNAFNKTDIEACEWVMLSAMLQLRQRAQDLGADAVINIRSNYKNNIESSQTEFTCGAGALVAGVALIGDFVITE